MKSTFWRTVMPPRAGRRQSIRPLGADTVPSRATRRRARAKVVLPAPSPPTTATTLADLSVAVVEGEGAAEPYAARRTPNRDAGASCSCRSTALRRRPARGRGVDRGTGEDHDGHHESTANGIQSDASEAAQHHALADHREVGERQQVADNRTPGAIASSGKIMPLSRISVEQEERRLDRLAGRLRDREMKTPRRHHEQQRRRARTRTGYVERHLEHADHGDRDHVDRREQEVRRSVRITCVGLIGMTASCSSVPDRALLHTSPMLVTIADEREITMIAGTMTTTSRGRL